MKYNEFIEKKGFLDRIFYIIGKQQTDIYLQYSNKKENVFTKWKKYSEVCFDYEKQKNRWFIEQCNQRQILPCEVVLDLEEWKTYEEIIKNLDAEYKVYDTGSRGFHVHLFFRKKLTEKMKLAIIKFFGADEQKCYEKSLIALENTPHWKSGKIKTEVLKNG